MATQNKVFIQIDDQRIELTGAELEAFNADKAILQAEAQAEAEAKEAKQVARTALLARLGITSDEAKLLLG